MNLFIKLFFITALITTQLNAQIPMNTTNNSDLNIDTSLSFSKIGYDYKDENIFNIERKSVGLGIITKDTKSVSLLFQIGHTYESKFDDFKLKGNGYMFGGGLGFTLFNTKTFNFMSYGILNSTSDKYLLQNKYFKKEIEMVVSDIHIGWVALMRANRFIDLYGALDLIPVSDGKILYLGYKLDVERNKLFNVKLGMCFNLPNVTIKPEVLVVGGKTFTLMATFNI